MNRRVSVLSLMIFFVLGVVFAAGLYFFLFRKNPIVVTQVSKSQTSPSATEQPQGLYIHPTLGYSFKAPLNWILNENVAPTGVTQDYQDVSLRSPDYTYSQPEESDYPMITAGAEIYISAEKTEETDIEAEFEKDTLAKSIAQNKVVTNIDGGKALQYDFSYEGVIASVTAFIKDGVFYFIKLSYPESADKSHYWETYASFLYSFKTK